MDPKAEAIAVLEGVVAVVQAAIEKLKITTVDADASGSVDVTSAFQAAFDKAGRIKVPAGRYLIDPVIGIHVRSGSQIEMDPDAILVAKPNDAPRYCVMRAEGVSDVSIKGGQIVGDRRRHTYTSESTHEWGYGLKVSGHRIKLSDIRISECTGDNLGVSGDDIEIMNVVCTHGRRQGMSIFTASNVRVYDSEFSLTGVLGTDSAAPYGPCAGVDIEPDRASMVDVLFERCKFNGNRAGFLAWLRSEVGGSIRATLIGCEMIGNANGAHAKALTGSIGVALDGCTLKNRSSGCRIEQGASFVITNNKFAFVGKDRTDFSVEGEDARTRYDIKKLTGGTAMVGLNHYQ